MSGPPDHFIARVMNALLKTGKSAALVNEELVDEVLHEMKQSYWPYLNYFSRVDDYHVQCVLCGHMLERWVPYDPSKSSTEHQAIHRRQVRWLLLGPERATTMRLMDEPTWEFTDFPQAIVDRRNAV